jgi:hypothetical protein
VFSSFIHTRIFFLAVNGQQSVICNGEVYQISSVPDVSPVPLVSVVQPVYASYNIATPTFFIALGILLMLFVVCILWGVRTIREKNREKRLAQENFESKIK